MKRNELREDLEKAIKNHIETEGTDLESALRDVLTDLRHIATNKQIFDFQSLINGSWEVFEEERCDGCGNEKRTFMHNCSGSLNMLEIYGCPKCDDTCGFCS